MIARHLSFLGLAFILISLAAVPSKAADFTFYVGGVLPGSVEHNNVNTSLDNSPIYGVRYSTNFVPFFGMEHTLAFSSDYLFPQNDPVVKEARGVIYNSNLIFKLPVAIHGGAPYLTAGAGLIHQYGDSNLPVGTKFAFNYGGGLKFQNIAGPLGLRFDMRGYSAGVFSDKLNMFEISAGVMLTIGK